MSIWIESQEVNAWSHSEPLRPYSAKGIIWVHFTGEDEPRAFFITDLCAPYKGPQKAAEKLGVGFIPVRGLAHPFPIPDALRNLSEILGVAIPPQITPVIVIKSEESADDIPF